MEIDQDDLYNKQFAVTEALDEGETVINMGHLTELESLVEHYIERAQYYGELPEALEAFKHIHDFITLIRLGAFP